jgi:Tol biopolymer transport system component
MTRLLDARARAALLVAAIVIVSGCAQGAPSGAASPTGSPVQPGSTTSARASSPTQATSPTPAPATPTPTPAITGLTGHILFTRAGGTYGDETLFLANADGTNEQRLSEFGIACCPWSTPDGSRIVYAGSSSADARVSTVTGKLDGSDKVVLPLPKGTLNLAPGPISPDGKLLAREGFDEAHPEAGGIYVTRASDGANLRRVTQKHFIPGDFSPDGTHLVLFLSSDESLSPPAPGSLWTVKLDGTGLRQLTPKATLAGCCFNYRWSPDGSKILFADPEGVLRTIAPDGSHLTQVFKDTDGRFAITPTWSPDGSMIMFGLDPSRDPFAHPVNGLYVIRADGSGLTEVIATPDFKREPVWVSG